MYQKEIIYMGLYKDGSRIGNAGFLKAENREDESRFYLKLQNIPYNIKGRFPIRLHLGNDWKEITGISVQEGGGSWEEVLREAAEGLQVQIMLPGGYLLEGKSKDAPKNTQQPAIAVQPEQDIQREMTAGMQDVESREERLTGEGRVERQVGESREKRQVGESREERQAEEDRAERQITETGEERKITEVRKERQIAESGEERQIAESGEARQIKEAGEERQDRESQRNRQVIERAENRTPGALRQDGLSLETPENDQTGKRPQNGWDRMHPQNRMSGELPQNGEGRATSESSQEWKRPENIVSEEKRYAPPRNAPGDDIYRNTAGNVSDAMSRNMPGNMSGNTSERTNVNKGTAKFYNLRGSRPGSATQIIPIENTRGRMNGARDRQADLVTEELQRQAAYNLKEDKWEQILESYERIHPYGDERVYVKLEPKDFIILQAKYQHLVNNSFLLHGFYNYRYIILGKEQGGYYLGVPGVFYEREKMVALMFGFEAFECPGGTARAGEFGYYLRKVEL